MTRPRLLSLATVVLLLTACGTEAPAPGHDAATDAALDTLADVAPDASVDRLLPGEHIPDVLPDNGADVLPVTDAGQDAAIDAAEVLDVVVPGDVRPDVVQDTARDEGPAPVDATDAGPDVVDAPADRTDVAAPDVASDVPCTSGATRCGGALVEACVAGAWTTGTCPTAATPAGTGYGCGSGVCVVCLRDSRTRLCTADPFCATDADCLAAGFGRCIAGSCAPLGIVLCADDTVCAAAWGASHGLATCESPGGGMLARCGGERAVACTGDAACPTSRRCSLPSGICIPR